ncbi:MAG: saccharopine dehydrogenase [Alphaproteobacteria bacterium]
MTVKLWVRAESKANERRVALVPDDAKTLVKAGYEVTVEQSPERAIAIGDYERAGCSIAEEGSWPDAPKDAFILGVKELPEGDAPLVHSHIYFGHVYKDQPGWQHTLSRFVTGGGQLFDLECLVDETGRRIAAFGYWAGYAGAAVAVQVWTGQQEGNAPPLAKVSDYPNVDALLEELNGRLDKVGSKPSMIVIGALGRSGSGATKLGEQLGLDVTKWDMAETASGGPFPAIRRHDIFVNCILASPSCPKFVTSDDVEAKDRTLSVIADVSCDPESRYNPIPIYNRSTKFTDPTVRVTGGPPPLDVMAIDHLPSMLPLESSMDYSRQLTPALLTLSKPEEDVWGRALADFKRNIARL